MTPAGDNDAALVSVLISIDTAAHCLRPALFALPPNKNQGKFFRVISNGGFGDKKTPSSRKFVENFFRLCYLLLDIKLRLK